ncbi:DUF6810 family protein [Candidatus Lucifugimonas marina]|uniref:DUF6810 domain-containing protein n=1 Tax=Candidatus Lucifugimonas marina TaxID=3038979 RepID=A0AAJ5ZDF9_9CHLR|nr:hypothetical protein [SAR202 cluster bacterium JH702]MDG0868341.1 hypothetical protein [SAR202 cluster bacterium JH639]WFG34977.1 hypothetical protein GKN94_04500 [SAR202 cluster bacterium JH545]WFG38935.1 hypothetical protein GKO48_04665 [SAR202 cluster bacterium JH1073]
MKYLSFLSICLGAVTLAAVLACGSENPGTASDQNTDTASENDQATSIIVDNGGIYTIEDFEAAGYKKVTQFDLETLPGAIDAWFGFANQKDFEIRIYPSHQVAVDHGIEPAKIAIGKGAVPWQRRPPRRFFSYLVVGNVVMLCELEVASCETLIAQLE